MTQAQAAILEEAGGKFRIRSVTISQPLPDEVLVRIVGVGICHTDLAVRDRIIPVPLPLVLGHEASGIVEAVGDGVDTVSPGDHVVLSFLSCGNCPACADHVPGYCDQFAALNFLGRRLDGSTAFCCDGHPVGSHFFGQSSFASLAIANKRNVVRVDSNLPLELLGPLGCGFLTGAGTVLHALDCAPGSAIAIFGAGPVGMAAIMAAKARGCRDIIAIDPLASRRAIAMEIGATAALDPGGGTDVPAALRSIVPRGANAALDTTGIATVISSAIDSLAKRGKLALVAAPKTAGATVDLRFGAIASSGIQLIGVMEGDCDPQAFIPELLRLQAAGSFPFERLIKTYPFQDIERAIAEQAEGHCVKAVLTMDSRND